MNTMKNCIWLAETNHLELEVVITCRVSAIKSNYLAVCKLNMCQPRNKIYADMIQGINDLSCNIKGQGLAK
jgi:hypothetical protein